MDGDLPTCQPGWAMPSRSADQGTEFLADDWMNVVDLL